MLGSEKLLATPTSGSMNLIQHMTKKDVSKEDGGAGGGGASVKYVTPRELLSHHEREMSHRRRKGSVATATSPRGRLASVPRLGAGLRPGEELVLASSVNVRAPPLSAAKVREIGVCARL
ncbi:PREDICTED: uncharacterized protein LOC106818317 [Priapulus caudatus]|uniref:Uncharacterized protein LOC106818317 n=1 Tax=Priapulus caudatus TaxID=37621 RepID=A0ABM1F250_PRICU|nr:PREDICTED: uncharacterized protein LOC106818317 [Priapulus caudatus]